MNLTWGVALALFACGLPWAQNGGVPASKPKRAAPANATLNDRERAAQILSRFTFGARPGDVDRVMVLGAKTWFAEQLAPTGVADGPLEKRLSEYPTLKMTSAQALAVFPDRGKVTQVADGKAPYPTDPLLKSVYEVQVYKLQQERAQKEKPMAALDDEEKAAQKKMDQAAASQIAGELFALPKKERLAALDAMPAADRIVFANNVGGDQRNTLFADFSPRERETVSTFQGGVGTQYRILDELAQARELREVLSEQQVQEVMTEFWFNHFNVFAPKDSDQWYTTAYERDAIRPHALGKFRDLLLATAESPAMMVYLDNWLSIGPDSVANGVDPKNPKSKQGKKGLNENYGREVMELHTVGVGGGYTQADVTKLAAILTGWGVDKPGQASPFAFDWRRHEPGTKTWFGYAIDDQGNVLTGAGRLNAAASQAVAAAPDGMKQGVAALALLAASPKTAHFISYLLAQRFVADDPPMRLVERLAATYLSSDGDVAAMLRLLVSSPEFNSRRYFRNKVKMPDEFVASAFRATATDPANPGAMVGLLSNEFGQPPYRKLEPTGYYVTADHWMNTQALMARLNFADQLTHNRFANQKFDSSRLLAMGMMEDRSASSQGVGSDVALRVLEATLIGGDITAKTDAFIHQQMEQQLVNTPADTLNLLTSLLLGSPEFQLR